MAPRRPAVNCTVASLMGTMASSRGMVNSVLGRGSGGGVVGVTTIGSGIGVGGGGGVDASGCGSGASIGIVSATT